MPGFFLGGVGGFVFFFLVFGFSGDGLISQRLLLILFYIHSGVALLPFVDEKRLLTCLAEVYPDLTEEERKKFCFYSKVLTVLTSFIITWQVVDIKCSHCCRTHSVHESMNVTWLYLPLQEDETAVVKIDFLLGPHTLRSIFSKVFMKMEEMMK